MTSAFHTHQTDHYGIENALARLSGQLDRRERDGEVGLSRALAVLAALVIIGLLALVILIR